MAVFLIILVFAGHALNVVLSIAMIDERVVILPQHVALTAVLCLVAIGVQITAYYVVAARSSWKWRWVVANTMTGLSLLYLLISVAINTAVGVYYVKPGEALMALVVGVLFCGPLLWLREHRGHTVTR